LTPADLAVVAGTPAPWLWHGYLGPGKLTLLTSQWKSGKTTLLSVLLARMATGGTLAGLPVTAGRAVIVSEEAPGDWHLRCQHLGIGDHAAFLCRPFLFKPGLNQWLDLVDGLADECPRRGTSLVVIDTVGLLLPTRAEASADVMFEALLPLQRLAASGVSVCLLHHPNKGKTIAGQAARGCGALPGFCDIVIEKGYYLQPNSSDRRRRLWGYSRYEATPRHLVIELTLDGTDYLVHAEPEEDDAFGGSWQVLQLVLNEAVEKLTRREILEHWPEDFEKPSANTLWRWLETAVAQGLLHQEGNGSKSDPFRYWLPHREHQLRPGPGATLEELQTWNARRVRESLDRIRTDGPEGANR
jgi:hypothetical protein